MPVLATKLHLPEPRPDLVARARLQERLSGSGHAPTRLVLVCAPAGFGKTTALTQWLKARSATLPCQVAWVSLDRDDNDVQRFLAHLLAALQRTRAELGRDAQAAIEAAGELDLQRVLASLVNDLDLLASRTVIALDDYHEITSAAVHEAVQFLLDHLPPQVQLAITTRSDPPLAIARLRSNAGLVEVRSADLRFTPDEAAALLRDVVGEDLPRSSIAVLDERTEGWAAGLRLAALSLRGRDDVAAFVDDFAGSHRFVLDYLVEQVLDRQPAGVTEFLLRTSLLASMNAPLCEAVTGREDATEILAALERDNVFVVALDDERQWYRYHHLFADVLQARLRSTGAAEVARLHREASRWYVEHGILPDALRHAVDGGDLDLAADLVELALPGLRQERRDDTIRAHVRALPEDVVRGRALLATFMAWTRLADGDLEGVLTWLDEAESALPRAADLDAGLRSTFAASARARDDELRQLPAMIAVYRATVAQARGDVERTIEQARCALDLTGPADHFARAAAAGFLGLATWADGDLAAAVDIFGEAMASMRAAGSVADQLGSTVVLASIWLGRGRPDEARRLYERALWAADRTTVPVATVGDLHVGLADVLREMNELDEAGGHLAAAKALGDAASLPENRYRWYVVNAGLLAARGDLEGALEMLERAEASYQPGFFPDIRPIPALTARVHIARGDLAEAAEWARRTATSLDDPPTYLSECNQLTLARLVLVQRRRGPDVGLEQVRDLLTGVLAAASASGRVGSVIEARVVQALANAAGGDSASAERDLCDALAAGCPVGYRRLFLDEGAALHGLLRDIARKQSGDVAAWARQLLSDAVMAPARAAEHPSALAGEGLSDREVEVLRLLATDLTGPEIARRLFVSVNTLRTHTKHIFTKLGVNSRRAAVRRAAELGVLTTP